MDEITISNNYEGDFVRDDGPAQADAERKNIIASLAESLLKKRDESVKWRAASGVERRWQEDEDSFDGLDISSPGRQSMMDYATGAAYIAGGGVESEAPRSRVIANIVRAKCETAWGRYCDIQFPVDDRNWGLKVTPVPELSAALKDKSPAIVQETGQTVVNPDGQPAQVRDVARSDMDKAKEAMKLMEAEIDDQFTESGFNGECRRAAWDAIKIGTGILKGPNVVKRIKRSWQQQADATMAVYVMASTEEYKPESKRVDPWNVFPDPDCGDDIKRASYIWEKDYILPRELRLLIGVDGYFDDQIIEVLLEEPLRTSVVADKKNNLEVSRRTGQIGAHYEKWEYNGDMDRDDLEAMGVDCSHDTLSQSLSACVVFVNDKPIKVVLNPLDTGDMPYDFFTWTPVSNSVWGIGVARQLIWWSRIITAGWRAMMDNAGDSSGAQVVIGKGIRPADGKRVITGKKLWEANGEVDDVNKAFGQFQIANNQEPLQRIIDLALKFVDMETSMPMLFQGEKNTAPETLGATNIMVDSSNVALRGRVKRWDDSITVPHVRRYYHWNMQYNDKNEIKGDYNVDARGASVLLARDNQNNAILSAFQMKQDPDISAIIDWKKATRLLFTNQHLDVLKSDEELQQLEEEKKAAAQNQPPADPRVQGNIEVAQMKIQGDMEKEKLKQQSDVEDMKLKREALEAEYAFKQQQAELDRKHAIQMKVMERDMKIMELSQSRGISIDQIKADLSIKSMELTTQKELSGMKSAIGKQVDEPPTEPAQHAPDGRAYQE